MTTGVGSQAPAWLIDMITLTAEYAKEVGYALGRDIALMVIGLRSGAENELAYYAPEVSA